MVTTFNKKDYLNHVSSEIKEILQKKNVKIELVKNGGYLSYSTKESFDNPSHEEVMNHIYKNIKEDDLITVNDPGIK